MTNFRKSRAITDPPGSCFVRVRPGHLLLALALYAAGPAAAMAMPPAMSGPRQAQLAAPAATQPVSPTPFRQALMAPIRWFQSYVSPMDGPRCQFAPTCSAFGSAAVRDHGPWQGLLMTADRLQRCSHLTDPRDYPHRPDGYLIDPVAGNLLENR